MEWNLFSTLDGLSVSYVNHEGRELPLKNIKDFNEAIRSAKWREKNHLNLIFYDHKLKANEAADLNNGKFAITGRFSKSQKIPKPDKDLVSNNFSQCLEGSFPEWFKQYMKKFKKEVLKDLRTVVREMVQEEFEKRKKLDEPKLFKSLSHKNEVSSPMKLKKKKKISDKDSFDLLEKGDTKLLKKIEKFHSSKFDRVVVLDSHLEKLVNRTGTFLNEKKKLLEKIRHIKLKEAKKKSVKNKKSAIFHQSDVFLFLEPGAEFSITVNILNNGAVPLLSPHMECLNTPEVCLEEPIIELPRLEPGQNVNATLRGKVPERLGNYYFAYKLSDGLEEFGPLFWCFLIVSDSKKEIKDNSSGQLKPEKIPIPTRGLVSTFINSEKVMIVNSQKKIEENIIEIERRLQDINALRFCTSSNEREEASLDNNTEDFEIAGCDLQQQDNEKKCLVGKSEEEVSFEANPLQQQEETEKAKQMDANIKCKNFETNKYGKESDSDSELSVIFMSEEDENFIYVPFHSQSSNSETVNNSTKLPKFVLNKEPNEANQKPKKDESCPTKVELEGFESKESSISENCLPSQLVTEERFRTKAEPSIESFCASAKAASRDVISNESTKESVPGNLSFKVFKEENHTNHTRENSLFNTTSKHNPVSHATEEKSFFRNTKAGDKTNYVQNAFDYVFNTVPLGFQNFFNPLRDLKKNNIARKDHRINVPTTDRLGRVIYAVRGDGYCLPIKDLIQNKVGAPGDGKVELKEETNINYKARGETPNGIFCPNVPPNSASNITNVTSLDFDAAKFVDNNLQSALNPEVEIMHSDIKKKECFMEDPDNIPHNLYPIGAEERQYAEKLEKQEKYINAMLTLHEMGFLNSDLNFRLLKKYDNELIKVVNEILNMPAMETQQDAE